MISSTPHVVPTALGLHLLADHLPAGDRAGHVDERLLVPFGSVPFSGRAGFEPTARLLEKGTDRFLLVDKFTHGGGRRGIIKLAQMQEDSTQRIVRLLGPGAIIGLETLLKNPYRYTAVALQDIDTCRITTATLEHLEAEKFELNEKVMAHWERHLSIADRWISELSSGTVRSRALKLFQYLVELNGGESDTVRFFSREDMAAMLGTTRETFTRIVAELKDEGIITRTEDSQIFRYIEESQADRSSHVAHAPEPRVAPRNTVNDRCWNRAAFA